MVTSQLKSLLLYIELIHDGNYLGYAVIIKIQDLMLLSSRAKHDKTLSLWGH